MVSLDDLKDLRIYKKQFLLPTTDTNIRKNSAIILLTPNRKSSINLMSSPFTINRRYFESYYAERNISKYIKAPEDSKDKAVEEAFYNEDPGEYLFEQPLSYGDKKDLPDEDFGLPKERRYPMPDEEHVLLAIRFFNHVEESKETELARNIIKKVKKFDMADQVKVGDKNRFKPYWLKSGLATSNTNENAIDNIPEDSNLYDYYFSDKIAEAISNMGEYKDSITEAYGSSVKELEIISVIVGNKNNTICVGYNNKKNELQFPFIVQTGKESPEELVNQVCSTYLGITPDSIQWLYDFEHFDGDSRSSYKCISHTYYVSSYSGQISNLDSSTYKFMKALPIGGIMKFENKSPEIRYFLSRNGFNLLKNNEMKYASSRLANASNIVFDGYESDIAQVRPYVTMNAIRQAFENIEESIPKYQIRITVSSEQSEYEYMDERNLIIYTPRAFNSMLFEIDYKQYISYVLQLFTIHIINPDVYDNISNPIAMVLSGIIDDELAKEPHFGILRKEKFATERVYKYILDTYGMARIKLIIRHNDYTAVLRYANEYYKSLGVTESVKEYDLGFDSYAEAEEAQAQVAQPAEVPTLDDLSKFGTKLKRKLRSKSTYKLNKITRDIERGNVGAEKRSIDVGSLESLKNGMLAGEINSQFGSVAPPTSTSSNESLDYYKIHSNGDIVACENMVYLFEDAVDSTLRKSMWKDRLKTKKDIINVYNQVKTEAPFIKYAYPDIARYMQKNVFVDLSYYIESFFRNASFLNQKGKLNTKRYQTIFATLMERLISDTNLSGYTKKTIFIPVLDWRHNSSMRMWMYKQDINAISFIYDMIQSGNVSNLNKLFGECNVVFFGGRNYFKVNFKEDDFSKQQTQLKFTKLIKRLVELGFTAEDPDPEDDAEQNSPTGIAMDLVDKVEKAKKVEINDVSDFKNLKKKADIFEEDKEKNKAAAVEPTVAKAHTSKEEAIKATKVKDPSVDRAVNATSSDEKKKSITKSIAKAANDSSTTDEALDKLDKDEEFKRMVEDLGNDSESNVKVDKTRASKMAQMQEEFKNKEVQGKSVKDLLKVNPNDQKLETTKLPVASINGDWSAVSFVNFDKNYDPDSDIVKMINSMANWTYPIVVKDISVVDNSTSEDLVDLWTITCEDFKGTRFTIKLDVPKFIPGSSFLKLRGNEKVINIQSTLVPVIKTELDTCQIIGLGGYNKIFVRRFGSRVGQSTPAASKLLKALNKYDGDKIKVEFGNATEICSKYELPIDYIDISGYISKITAGNTTYYFNQDELRESYKVDDTKGLPIAVRKDKDKNGNKIEVIEYYSPDTSKYMNFISQFIALELTTIDPKFKDIYDNIRVDGKFTYSKATILGVDIPVIIICSYLEGLIPTLRKANIEYEFVRELDKKVRYDESQGYIQFADGYLVYKADYASSLLLNGFKECDTETYSVKEVNQKQMYVDFLENFGGSIKADGLMNSYDCMIDPITKEILEIYKLPTDYVGVLLYASHLLSDNKCVRHVDQSVRRWRRKELIAGYFYRALTTGYETYANSTRHNRKAAKLAVKQSAIIDAILSGDPSTSDLSVNNSINDVECAHTVSNKGLSGMNVERAYTIDTRGYDESMLNVLGMDTPFSGTVGINRQATIDPSIMGARGIVTTIDGDIDKLSVAKSLTITEAMTPLGVTHDDPNRTLMTYVQTSKHTMRCENNDPMLITTGADEALAYMTSDIFAFKAKGPGEVIELVQEGFGGKNYMVIEYKNGTHDYVDLSEEIKKNSDGGYSVPVQLSTDLHVGSKVKENDVIAYDKLSFSKSLGESGNLAASLGTIGKVAIINTDEGFEDSAAITESFAKKLTTNVVMPIECIIDKGANIAMYKKIGDHVMEGETLMVSQSDFDDDAVNALLKNLTVSADQISELGRNPVKSKYTGVLADVKVYRTVELDEMSESLRKFVSSYERNIKQTKAIYDKYGISKAMLPPSTKLDQVGKTKNVDEAVKIIFYIKYGDTMSVGDKIVFYSANKGIIKYIIPADSEPYTSFRPDEHVDSFMSLSSISGRMTCSIPIFAATSKLMIELDRSIKDIAGIPYDVSKR